MTFNKTLDELFQTKDDHPELLKKVDEALNIAEEHETRAEARARKIAELEALAAQGGVKGTKAKHELALLLDAPTKEDDQARIDAQYAAAAQQTAQRTLTQHLFLAGL